MMMTNILIKRPRSAAWVAILFFFVLCPVHAFKPSRVADVFFEHNDSTTGPAEAYRFDQFWCQIEGLRHELLIAVGHADSLEKKPVELSLARAAFLKRILVERGVEAQRIYVEGKGAKQPITANATREGRWKNRRVEIEYLYVPDWDRKHEYPKCNPLLDAIDRNDLATVKKIANFPRQPRPGMIWAPAIKHALVSRNQVVVDYLLSRKILSRLPPHERTAVFHVLVEQHRADLLLRLPLQDTTPERHKGTFDPFAPNMCGASAHRVQANEVIDWAVAKGFRLDGRNNQALKCAIESGDRAMIVRMQSLGADLNASNEHTPPAWSSASDDPDFLDWLKSRGARFEARSTNGETALHVIKLTSAEGLDWLLRQGIDINSTNARGETPLYQQLGILSAEVVLAMSLRGADLAKGNAAGRPLFVEALVRSYRYPDVIPALLDAGMDCKQAIGPKRRSFLHLMLEANLPVGHLLERSAKCGLDVRAVDSEGNTALHLAVFAGDPAILRTLAKVVGDVNAKNAAGDTALHLVATKQMIVPAPPPRMWGPPEPQRKPYFSADRLRQKLAAIEAMLEAGARIDVTDARGLTPVQRIGDPTGQEKVVELLSP